MPSTATFIVGSCTLLAGASAQGPNPFVMMAQHIYEESGGKLSKPAPHHGSIGQRCSENVSWLPGSLGTAGRGFDIISGRLTSSQLITGTTAETNQDGYLFCWNEVCNCYYIPDAFVNEAGDLGWYLDQKVDFMFKAMSGTNAYDVQQKLAKKLEVEAKLKVTYLGFSAEAAMSHSETMDRQRSMSKSSGYDSSLTEATIKLYTLKVQKVHPTPDVLAFWGELSKLSNKTEDFVEFESFFNTYGTHYVSAAEIGGQLSVAFTVNEAMTLTATSNSQSRADCVSAKLSAHYMGVVAEASSSVCASAFEGDSKDTKASDYMSQVRTSCTGGIEACPLGTKGDVNMSAWVEKVGQSPTAIVTGGGDMQWMHQMVREVVRMAETNEELQQMLQKYYDSQATLEENLDSLRKLSKTMLSHMQTYIGEDYYCKNVDKNCHDKASPPKPKPLDPTLSPEFGGPHGTPFSDLDHVGVGQGVRTFGIQGNRRLDRVQTTLANGTVLEHGGRGGNYAELHPKSGEYVQRGTICVGKKGFKSRVFFLELVTSKGRSLSAGTPTDDCNTLSAPTGMQISGFHGRSGDEVDMLGFVYTQI